MSEQTTKHTAERRVEDYRAEPAPPAGELLRGLPPNQSDNKARPDANGGGSPRLSASYRMSVSGVAKRWTVLRSDTHVTDADYRTLLDDRTIAQMGAYGCNIENFIGSVKVPIGVVGPLKIDGTSAKGEFFLPLATTEAALVASYNRGVSLITEAGGCMTAILDEKLGRAPLFEFRNIREATEFISWVTVHLDDLRRVARSTTRYGRLVNLQPTVNGNQIFLLLEYVTGDAAGQNMTTIATEAICKFIFENYPVKPQRTAIESNYCGDKKANARSFTTVRGKRVTADVVIGRHLLEKRLGATPAQMVTCWQNGALGCVMSGAIGIQAHYANGLAALFLATGQDVACVAESAVGITRFQQTVGGDLYASVTLPNLVVGSVGGGTGLPAQAACLRIANCFGSGNGSKLAELCAGLCLAGELSLIAAIAVDHFTQAHLRLARWRAQRSALKSP